MKKFLLIVIGMVGLGLAIRFTINRPDKPKAKPIAPTVQKVEPPKTVEVDPVKPEPEVKPVPPPEPEPPRIKGATLVTNTSVREFVPTPGHLYYCEGTSVMSAPKSGEAAERIGDCNGQVFDWRSDAQGAFYCNDSQLMRITHGAEGSRVVVDEVTCMLQELDAQYAYYVVPSWDDAPDFGLYRVARAGGTPEKIYTPRKGAQLSLVDDGDSLWVSSYFAGTIAKLSKTAGAKPKPMISGQKGVEEMVVDATYIYWYADGSGELRRRKKAGGTIEVIGRGVDTPQLAAVDGHIYWFENVPDKGERLMHLAPGKGPAEAEQLAEGLRGPSLRADSDGVYVNELDRDGIFMFKR